jgi:hypothetical protein
MGVRVALVGSIVCVLVIGVTVAFAAATWTWTPTPNGGTGPNALNGVAALSPTSAWSVGHSYNPTNASYRTLVERWNGTSWTVVPSPNPTTANAELWDVVALSPSLAWAVGYGDTGSAGGANVLIERWNGASWSIVPTPTSGTLTGVAASGPNDVWAVGRALTMHYNGSSWSVVPAQLPSSGSFYAVATLGPSNAWAVGSYPPVLGKPRIDKTLIAHWDGSSWKVVPSPNAASSNTNVLHGVVALAANNVWAVGWYYPVGSLVQETLIEHWDGTSWKVVPSPNGAGQSALWDVTALAANDVWAAGYTNSSNGLHTLVEHWDGTSWTINPSPNPGLNPRLQAIASVAPGTVWGVGITGNSTTDRTLALRTTQG